MLPVDELLCIIAGTLVSVSEPAASSTPSPKQDVPDEAQQQHEVEEQQQRQQQDDETDSIEEDRHNFALSKDGAKIVACNKEAKKCSAILDTDSDTFMKNDCKADKWLIMELSQVCCAKAFLHP